MRSAFFCVSPHLIISHNRPYFLAFFHFVQNRPHIFLSSGKLSGPHFSHISAQSHFPPLFPLFFSSIKNQLHFFSSGILCGKKTVTKKLNVKKKIAFHFLVTANICVSTPK